MRGSILGIVLVALALQGVPAHAQEVGDVPLQRYTMLVVGGQTVFDETAALKDAPYLGIEGIYNISRFFGLGGYLMISQPVTNAEFFPLLRLAFSDTAYYFLPSQQVTQLGFGINATGRLPLGQRLALIGSAGVGQYVFRLDLQRARARPELPHHETNGWSAREYMVGGGIHIALPRGGGLRLMVRDLIYTDFERDILGLNHEMLASEGVPHPDPFKPEAKSTTHNLRFEVGMSFVPGQTR